MYNIFLEDLSNFLATSTLHGLRYIGEKLLSKAERIFWLISFLIAVVLAICFIISLFINYNDSPVTVGFGPEMVSVETIPFPAITICNMNVAYKSRAARIKKSGTFVEKLILDDLCKLNYSSKDPGTITWDTMEKLIMEVTQKCQELIVGCEWRGRSYDNCSTLLNVSMTDDGYCCSFNKLPLGFSHRHPAKETFVATPSEIINWTAEDGYPPDAKRDIFPYRAFGRGVEQGLTLVLDAAIHEYYCSSTNSFGFKTIFHSPRETPRIADSGFLIPPGVEMRISIKVKIEHGSQTLRGVDSFKRNCFFIGEKVLRFFRLYTAKNCLLECESNYTEAKCGCVPYFLPRDHNMRICDKSDDQCKNEAKFVIEQLGPEKLACGCLPACSQVNYSPGFQSVGLLKDIHNITFRRFVNNFSMAYFVENMAIIHIFYSEDRFQVQFKANTYSFSEFLSNTGGLLSFFLGFSFISLVELIYFFFMRGACAWCQRKHNRAKKQRVFLH